MGFQRWGNEALGRLLNQRSTPRKFSLPGSFPIPQSLSTSSGQPSICTPKADLALNLSADSQEEVRDAASFGCWPGLGQAKNILPSPPHPRSRYYKSNLSRPTLAFTSSGQPYWQVLEAFPSLEVHIMTVLPVIGT